MKRSSHLKPFYLVGLFWLTVSLACNLGAPQPQTPPAPTFVVIPAESTNTEVAAPLPADTETATDPTETTPTGCPTDTFVDVSTYHPRSGWPAPKLNVTCDAEFMTIETNGVPNFAVAIQQNDKTFSVKLPLNPQKNSQPTDFRGGIVGVAVDGVQIWAPLEAPQDGFADPVKEGLIETCGGHAKPFHFHANPTCLFPSEENKTSLVLGYAIDGFSILAPYTCDDAACTKIRKVKSSWQFSGANSRNVWDFYKYVEGSGDLDRCNGMIGPDGLYHYYATDTFPYFIACYSGTPTTPIGDTGAGEPGGNPPPKKP